MNQRLTQKQTRLKLTSLSVHLWWEMPNGTIKFGSAGYSPLSKKQVSRGSLSRTWEALKKKTRLSISSRRSKTSMRLRITRTFSMHALLHSREHTLSQSLRKWFSVLLTCTSHTFLKRLFPFWFQQNLMRILTIKSSSGPLFLWSRGLSSIWLMSMTFTTIWKLGAPHPKSSNQWFSRNN